MQNVTKQQAEFLKVLTRCQGTLMKVCLYYHRHNPDNLRDLYQDIVCVLWERWPTFRDECDVNTWVTQIALNVAAQRMREHKRMPSFVQLDEDLCDAIADEAVSPLHDRLYHLIAQLDNDDDRNLLYLYLEKKSILQIAEIMNITYGAARQRLRRIKTKLIQLNNQIE